MSLPRLRNGVFVLHELVLVFFVESTEEAPVGATLGSASPSALFLHAVHGISDIEGLLEGSETWRLQATSTDRCE